MVRKGNLAVFESRYISETGIATPTKIGVHAFDINPYLHEREGGREGGRERGREGVGGKEGEEEGEERERERCTCTYMYPNITRR